jgi:hypothetical protein
MDDRELIERWRAEADEGAQPTRAVVLEMLDTLEKLLTVYEAAVAFCEADTRDFSAVDRLGEAVTIVTGKVREP